ncbi:MAG: FAD-dependent oxidoreductase [Acidobacteria bacterium]|nr:FAD-dependent oxidoreductase [Acidobacteriota bacterium]
MDRAAAQEPVRPIEEACYWLATRRHRPQPRLEGDARADIAIVGAGYTGLWTALFLKELDPGADIAVIEQGVAAYGASGRNAGMLAETIDHTHQLAIRHFGLEEARLLAHLGRENIEEMFSFMSHRGIDCELEQTGRLLVALTEGQVEDCRHTVEAAERLGVTDYRILSACEARSELDSPLYLGGVMVPSGGILNPAALVDGLLRAAVSEGVRVFERSRVTRIDQTRDGLVLRTGVGALRARKTILAMSAYTHHLLPGVLRRFIPLYDYILVSEPLTAGQLASIGWQHRQGVTDGRTFFNYYRLTSDNRLVWGTSEATYFGPNRVDEGCDHSEPHYASLRDSFKRHFPALAEIPFPYAWGGPICSTTRMTPFFGSANRGRILYVLGFTGHGIGSTRLAGKILAHLALEKMHPLLDLSIVRRKPFPYPPEPFRSMAVNAVTAALRRVDAGHNPSLLLRILDAAGIGFSS